MTEYQYVSVSQKPALQLILDSVSMSAMSNKNLTDISYHPREEWLKIWFDSDLSVGDKAILDDVVSNAVSVGSSWRKEVGSEYFELSPSENQGWVVHGGRIKFNKVFGSVPKVSILTATGDGTFDLTVSQVTKNYFDFKVRAKVRGRSSLSSITFDWEAAI